MLADACWSSKTNATDLTPWHWSLLKQLDQYKISRIHSLAELASVCVVRQRTADRFRKSCYRHMSNLHGDKSAYLSNVLGTAAKEEEEGFPVSKVRQETTGRLQSFARDSM